ncbi:unnamed protein product [Clonostachys rosea]|uniref:CC domain-containing protein n=1 Tax=Bionectria ochroleuca TaxID=29856 RepID=A0ABY6URE8_BIOOC|nr:unnamed protein product [Clonostachys rosea]
MAPMSKAMVLSLFALAVSADSCPSGQRSIANNRCCPGKEVRGDGLDFDIKYCCVTDYPELCTGISCACKEKINVDDRDYDKKVEEANVSSAACSKNPSHAGMALGLVVAFSVLAGSWTIIIE